MQGDSEVKGDRQESRKDTEEAAGCEQTQPRCRHRCDSGQWSTNAGCLRAARAVVVMQHQSEGWFRRGEAEAAGEGAAQPSRLRSTGGGRGEGDSEALGTAKRGQEGRGWARSTGRATETVEEGVC